jgi:hypothetical protein
VASPKTPSTLPKAGGLRSSRFAEEIDAEPNSEATPDVAEGEHDSSSAALASV